MNIFISESGVASTLLRNFSDTIGVDLKTLPLEHIAYTRLDTLGEDTALVLFPQSTDTKPAHSLTQLDFAGFAPKLGLSTVRGLSLFYFQELKDLLRAIQTSKTIYVVKNSEVYKHER